MPSQFSWIFSNSNEENNKAFPWIFSWDNAIKNTTWVQWIFSSNNPDEFLSAYKKEIDYKRHINIVNKWLADQKASEEAYANRWMLSKVGSFFTETLPQYAKRTPWAIKDIFNTVVSDPLKASVNVIGGALDAWPTAFNSAVDIKNTIQEKLGSALKVASFIPWPVGTTAGALSAPNIEKLPEDKFIGKTLVDVYENKIEPKIYWDELLTLKRAYESNELPWGYSINDINKAVKDSTTLASLYMSWEWAATRVFGNTLKARLLGDVLGGQLSLQEATWEERLKQMAFDTVFNLWIEWVGAWFNRAFSKVSPNEVKPTLKEVKPETWWEILAKPVNSLRTSDGWKAYARAEIDSKTGNAIVFYDKKLDLPWNESLKLEVLWHEYGHIVNKRLENIAPELWNYKWNKVHLDTLLEDSAKEVGKSTEDFANSINLDIKKMWAKAENPSETFAEAIRIYQQDPIKWSKEAPDFSQLVNKKLVEIPWVETQYVTKWDLVSYWKWKVEKIKQNTKEAIKETWLETTWNKQVSVKQTSWQVSTSWVTKKELKSTWAKSPESSSFNPNMSPSDDINAILAQIEADNKSFKWARAWKTNEQIKELAQMVWLDEKAIKDSPVGSIVNSETATKIRQVIYDKSEDLLNTIKSTDMSTATPEILEWIKNKIQDITEYQSALAGFRTEASNLLRSFGVTLEPWEYMAMRELWGIVHDLWKKTGWDVSDFANWLGKEIKLSLADKIKYRYLWLWYASVLSWPATFLKNIVSTVGNIATESLSRLANPARWNEVPAYYSWLVKWTWDMWSEVKKGLSNTDGKPDIWDDAIKRELARFTGKWEWLNKTEHIGRVLNASDKWLMALSRSAEKSALANKPISKELSQAISDSFAESSAFRWIPKWYFISKLRNAAQSIRKSDSLANPKSLVGNIVWEVSDISSKSILPFVDTIANVLDRSFDYLPVTNMIRRIDDTLPRQAENIAKKFNLTDAADKAFILDRLKAQQTGRVVLWTLTLWTGLVLADQGLLTGNWPKSIDEMKQLEATGWRKNSIKIWDTYVPYSLTTPLGATLSAIGSVSDSAKYNNLDDQTMWDKVSTASLSTMQFMLDQSFLSGISDIFEVLNGDKNLSDFGINFAYSRVPVPWIISQPVSAITWETVNTRNLWDKMMEKIYPEEHTSWVSKITALGDEKKRDLIYWATPSKINNDWVLKLLIDKETIVAVPSKKKSYIMEDEVRRPLTEVEYKDYITRRGKLIKSVLSEDLKYYNELSPEDFKAELATITEEAWQEVRDSLIEIKQK